MIYKTWDSTFRKGDATKKANAYIQKGLKAKVVKKKNAYSPTGYSYEIKVAGSLFNITKKPKK
jgi:hypothetical protein